VHDDPATLDPLAAALMLAGHGVARFDDAMDAWEALREATTIEVLITRVRFGKGKPHGLGLVVHTRKRRPNVKVIFTGSPRSLEAVKNSAHAVLPVPLKIPEAVATVQAVLA